MSAAGHRRHGRAVAPHVRVGVLTASDSRNHASDESGRLIERALGKGHSVVGRIVVPDEPARLRRAADRLLADGAEVLVVNGGTGLAPRDLTLEAFEPWFEKELPGFGELFRSLSLREVGAGAWLSRATAATVRRRGRRALLFLLPGSPKACRLAVRELILPELPHAVSLLRGRATRG